MQLLSSSAVPAEDLLRAPQRQVLTEARIPHAAGAVAAARDDSKAVPIDIKARAVFDACWTRLVARLGGLNNLQTPRELVFLNGAPGSGKSSCTPFILRSRGLSRSVCVSTLLAHDAAAQAAIASGDLVSDTIVVDALLGAIFDTSTGATAAGAVIDGFPRTPLQVDLLCLLYDKLHELHVTNADHSVLGARFQRPTFRVVILFVDEHTSVARQMQRGVLATKLQQRALAAGMPLSAAPHAVRSTDASEAVARHRYAVFRSHYATLLRLKERFPFSLVDGCGSLTDTEAQISRELRYQSSLELSERAYASIRNVPLAGDLVADARRQLVARLDAAAARQPLVFADVVALIDAQLLPVLRRAALAGRAVFTTDAAVLMQHPEAAEMLVDVLSDRGFAVVHSLQETHVPVSIDTATGAIILRTDAKHVLDITFERALLRRSPRLVDNANVLSASTTKPAQELRGMLAAVAPQRSAAVQGDVPRPEDVFDITAPKNTSSVGTAMMPSQWGRHEDPTEVAMVNTPA